MITIRVERRIWTIVLFISTDNFFFRIHPRSITCTTQFIFWAGIEIELNRRRSLSLRNQIALVLESQHTATFPHSVCRLGPLWIRIASLLCGALPPAVAPQSNVVSWQSDSKKKIVTQILGDKRRGRGKVPRANTLRTYVCYRTLYQTHHKIIPDIYCC